MAVLWLLPLACSIAVAQNTTISGTVYDPRTTSAALPLPNVLVYASTTPVSAPPSGVQCLTYKAPTGSNVVSYAYTAVDGTFTLQNVPENASYIIVIQAGKWMRQFNETVGAAPLAGLTLNMPANHTQGNIPMIAVVTGRVDGVECVLRDMGVADTEFTDDSQTVNPGGHIHLYTGGGSNNQGVGAGAQASSSTPTETALTQNAALLTGYDMVMFPCQGEEYTNQLSAASQSNLVGFANVGGRLFTTHYSYVYINSGLATGEDYDSQFPAVADWTAAGGEQQINAGTGTVATNFSDAATLALWLENSDATVTGTGNQVDITNVRTDVNSVVAPTQSWLTLNNGSYIDSTGQQISVTNNPVMQMTFNTPVGSQASSQCGRVMYNDYHVININVPPPPASTIYPSECPSYNDSSYTMSAQEQMLEYALFDLSAFVQPVVVPTLNTTFNPSPLVVKSGDTSDQVTVNVANTSTTAAIDSSAILTFTLPSQVTVTAMNDSTGGWICTVGTLTCIRNTSLAANATDPVTLTVSVASYTTLASYAGTITATVSSVTFTTNPSFTDNVIFQQLPSISWATPAPIVYGTPLSATQLDATSTVAGSFVYSPAAGIVLNVGQQTLMVTFTPTDTVDYTTATVTVTLNVIPAAPLITLTASANPVFMTYAVSFTASLPANESTQTGTMTFYNGSTELGAANVSGGSATFTTTALAAGTQSITAVYSGDADFGSGTSNAVAENIQDFTLAFAPGSGSASVSAGSQAVYTLVVTPIGGATLPAGVSLASGNLPLGMTVAFSPATVSANSGTTTVTLDLNLPGNSANERPREPFGSLAFPVALGLVLLPIAGKLRKTRARLVRFGVLLVLAAALAAGFTGCGGKLAPQSLSFTVTASSGSLAHSVTAQLSVK